MPAKPSFVTKSIFLPISERTGMFTPFGGRLRTTHFQPLRGAACAARLAKSRSMGCRLGNLDRVFAIIYIPGRDRAWNGAGDKVARIYCKTRPLDRRAETTSRGPQAQDRERQSASRSPCMGRSARRGAREGADGAGLPGCA